MVNGIGYFHTREGAAIRYAVSTPAVPAPAATVVLLGGRAEFIEKHEETIAAFENRDYRVCTMDWRGQGLSERLLKDRHKGHIKSFRQYLDDLHAFMEAFVWPNAVSPVIFLAHSMGGHITLRYLVEQAPSVAAAILVSPMIRINTFPIPGVLLGPFLQVANRAGWSERYIPAAGPYDPGGSPFENNPLTSDRERFMKERRIISQNPALALGGVTYGWLFEAFKSMDRLLSAGSLRTVATPILIVGGSADRVVSVPAMRRVCRRLPACRFVKISHAKHEILNETDSIRLLFWNEFDKFVQTAISTTHLNHQGR